MDHFHRLKDLTLKNKFLWKMFFVDFAIFYGIRYEIIKFNKTPAKKGILAAQEVTVPKKTFFLQVKP